MEDVRGKLGIWILASRPKTLPAAAAPVFVGTAMAWEAGRFHLGAFLMCLLGALLIQIGTNFANDYFDHKKGVDDEHRLGPLRVTQAGLVSHGEMRVATAIVFGLAAVCGAFLVWRAGWPILILGVLSIASGILYTGGPYPLGYNGLGDLFVLLFFGFGAVAGTYYSQALDIGWVVILAGLGPGLFSAAILDVNNLRDVHSDRRAGKKTLPVRFGERFARIEYTLCVVIACCTPFLLNALQPGHPWAYLAALTVIPAIPLPLKTIWTEEPGPVMNDTLAQTGKLLLLYSVLFSLGWVIG
jgi:1,4-dihydroxy-2-naphthoate octaprenyltransferase